MSEIKIFYRLQKMNDEGMDIVLAPLSNIISVDKKNLRCTVTIGIDFETFKRLSHTQDFIGGFILANRKQFDAIAEV